MDLLAFWLPYTYKEGYLKLVNISSQCLGLRMTLILWSFSIIIYLNGKPGTYKLKAEPTVVQGKSGWKLPLDFRSVKKKEINIHWLDSHKLALKDDQIIWSVILNSLPASVDFIIVWKSQKLTQNHAGMLMKSTNSWISAIWWRKREKEINKKFSLKISRVLVKPTWNLMVSMATSKRMNTQLTYNNFRMKEQILKCQNRKTKL